jgi:hypothetical protein
MMNEDKNYTERPDLGTIDNLNLLRLVMLKEALKDEKTLSEIGRIVSKDLADQKTEYGGQVLWNNGKIKFNNVKAQEWSNNSYSNDLNIFLRGGLMTFHLHATQENDSPYAGPSGHWSGTGLGDWKVAAYSGHVDVVITAAGYTDSSKKAMRVNVDMYYVRDGRPFVIDLGIYEVTVTSLP